MPDKPDEEIRKSIKRFEESLPESERNPDAQQLLYGKIPYKAHYAIYTECLFIINLSWLIHKMRAENDYISAYLLHVIKMENKNVKHYVSRNFVTGGKWGVKKKYMVLQK